MTSKTIKLKGDSIFGKSSMESRMFSKGVCGSKTNIVFFFLFFFVFFYFNNSCGRSISFARKRKTAYPVRSGTTW